MKKIDGLFQATALPGRMGFDNPNDFAGFCTQHQGKRFVISCKRRSSYTEKERLYAFLHGCLIDCVVQALRDDGWEMVSEEVAYGYIKRMVGQRVVVNKNGKEMKVDIDFSEESVERLWMLVQDTIALLRNNHNFHAIPDADAYKERSGGKK